MIGHDRAAVAFTRSSTGDHYGHDAQGFNICRCFVALVTRFATVNWILTHLRAQVEFQVTSGTGLPLPRGHHR